MQVESSTDNAEEEGNWGAEHLSAGLVDWRWLGGGGRVVSGWGWLGDGGDGSVLGSADGGDESCGWGLGGLGGGGGLNGGGLWLLLNVRVDGEKTGVVDLSGLVILDLESVVDTLLEVTSWGPWEGSSVLNLSCGRVC